MAVKERLDSIFAVLLDDFDLANDTAQVRAELVKIDSKREQAFAAAKKRFAESGIGLVDAKKATVYEKLMARKFNAELLSQVLYPGIISATFRPNYVDPDISAPKSWRDVYRHDSTGKIVGWTRYDAGQTMEFNWEGNLVHQKDALGRCAAGRPVSYVRDDTTNTRARPDPRPLKMIVSNQITQYVFSGEDDLRGKPGKTSEITAK